MFMTDGYIGNDAEVIALTRKEIGRSRIFSFGVGRNVNRYLLDEVAIAGRGYAEYMDPLSNDSKELVERFYRRIGMPYLTEVEVDFGKLAVSDMRPVALPDLSALQPLVLHARYATGGEGDVTIRGRSGGKTHVQKIHVVLPNAEQRNGAISRLWARETINELERKPKGVPVDAVAITNVALRHSLLSKYTSFVAADSSGPKGNQPPLLVTQPNESPEGVDVGSAGGTVIHGGGGGSTTVARPAPLDSPPEPAPPSSGNEKNMAAESRGGGCAGCTTASRSSSSAPIAITSIGLGLALMALRRRRR
jgi:Ca-activated chloride channel homolog